jgi:hypothetical protein
MDGRERERYCVTPASCRSSPRLLLNVGARRRPDRGKAQEYQDVFRLKKEIGGNGDFCRFSVNT